MNPRNSIIPIFVPHYGCPHMCVFCDQNTISGEKKPADENDVISAIENSFGKLPQNAFKQVAFYGGSFTAIPIESQKRLLGAVQPYIESGYISSIRLSTRPDAINEDILAMLKLYHVDTIELGTQSLDDDVLKVSGRGHDSIAVFESSEKIKNAGFNLILQMMTGLPHDSFEKCIETANKIVTIKPNGVRIYPTVIIKDTSLYNMWLNGEYKEHSVEDAVNICSAIVPLFEKANIPIIRLGLNPTEDLSSGEAVAGAYHPALGELVYSRIMLNKAHKLLKNLDDADSVTLGVNKSDISKMVGQHRMNIQILEEVYSLKSVIVRQTACEKGEIVLLSVEKSTDKSYN